MQRYWLVAIGGGLGSLSRFGLSEWFATMDVWGPLAVLVINVSGCFTISFLNFVSDPSGRIYFGPRSRLLLMVGFCGGYTTFSSFSLASFAAMRTGHVFDLWLNVGLSHVLCLLAVWLGYRLAVPVPYLLFKVGRYLRG